MAKTSDALKILSRRRKKNPRLQKYYEEESLKYDIALAVRKLREKEGLTQSELAKKMGTTQPLIARLENTDYEGHSMQTLQRLAGALNRRLVVKFEKVA